MIGKLVQKEDHTYQINVAIIYEELGFTSSHTHVWMKLIWMLLSKTLR